MRKFIQTVQKQYTYCIEDVNKTVKVAEYAVRGRVPLRAIQIQEELDKYASGQTKVQKYPFTELTECNIGNPQTFGQPPLSFYREVLAGSLYPQLVKSGAITNKDVVNRIEYYLSHITGNMGAYTMSPGYHFARQSVAEYIQRRDNAKELPSINDLFLLSGASEGINMVLNALINHKSTGVMIPIPQYPLYSASIELLGGSQVNYFLDESKGWTITVQELEKQYKRSRLQGVTPKILCVINPGNPTGAVLNREDIEGMVKFAQEHGMVIISDEVYQDNVYAKDKKFHSLRKVVTEMPAPYNEVELVSLHSASKGLTGECGLRGGYMELLNFDPLVKAEILKLKSIALCSNSPGQLIVEMMSNPPRENAGFQDETVEKYQNERNTLFKGLVERSELISNILNGMENIESQPIEGAMYAFPQIKFSQKVLDVAKQQNMEPDMYYCLQVLENTGIVLVPGSGFGQKEGTHHFRTTNLIQPREKLNERMEQFSKFNSKFHAEHK